MALGLLPRLDALIVQLQDRALTRGIHTAIPRDGGLRSAETQWEKFREGRKQLGGGNWVPIDPVTRKGIVTNATPVKAPHCAHRDHDGSEGAAACDVAIVVMERIAWMPKDPGYSLYPLLGQIGEELGLAWGGRWPGKLADLDHFELPDWRELGSMTSDVYTRPAYNVIVPAN